MSLPSDSLGGAASSCEALSKLSGVEELMVPSVRQRLGLSLRSGVIPERPREGRVAKCLCRTGLAVSPCLDPECYLRKALAEQGVPSMPYGQNGHCLEESLAQPDSPTMEPPGWCEESG